MRWDSRGNANASKRDIPEGIPKPSSSVFCLQTSVKEQKHSRARVPETADDSEPFDSFDPPGNPSDPAIRAGLFVERYKALYVRLRNVHYIGKPPLDFLEALQLVEVFDDTTLDKLAYVWLKTDHEFAEHGTRTLAKFRSMATWCQEQLNAWEAQHQRELDVLA